MKDRIILDLCGGTGSWSQPYLEAGYDVRVVTLPGQDVRTYVPPSKVHGILAAPPCDHFSVSGAQYWPAKDADGRTASALQIVDACLRIIRHTDPEWWALENPVGRLRNLRLLELEEPRLIWDPCDYGDPYTKKTLLWGVFTPPAKHRVEPERVCSQGSWVQKLGGKSEKTKRLRSQTPPGFARAFFEANP
jgi:hypothetical protein